MEFIFFVLSLILGILVFFAIAFIIAVLLVIAQDMDRRRVYGNEYANYILKCMHKRSCS